MIILMKKLGRLGNAIFRLFAVITFCITYDMNSIIINYEDDDENEYKPTVIIDDIYFNNVLDVFIKKRKVPVLDKNSVIIFKGYFQHDQIYLSNKEKIKNFIRTHPYLILETDHSDKYRAIDIIDFELPLSKQHCNIVLHLRLEDFIDISWVMHPDTVKRILEELVCEYPENTITIVINKPTTELEQKYISYLTQNITNFKIESNDVITDFTIMRKAKILVCSCSTLSWAASMLSETLEKVYFPNLKKKFIWETITAPIANTVKYDYHECTREELITILE